MECSSVSISRPQFKFCKPDDDDADSNQSWSSDELLRKMFESQKGDWEMVGSDGEAYKFHEAVIGERMSHFRAIFAHPETKECVSKQVVVPPEVEMTGSAVEAFLRYAYYQDPINTSLEITYALIRAGHYYNIPNMVIAANDALHSNAVVHKKLDWLNFEESWKLYQEVWLWEEAHPSRKILMDNLAESMKEVCKNSSASANAASGCGALVELISKFVQDKPCLPPVPLGALWECNAPDELFLRAGDRGNVRRGSRNRNRFLARHHNSARESNDGGVNADVGELRWAF